jgi:hypothetical protein
MKGLYAYPKLTCSKLFLFFIFYSEFALTLRSTASSSNTSFRILTDHNPISCTVSLTETEQYGLLVTTQFHLETSVFLFQQQPCKTNL